MLSLTYSRQAGLQTQKIEYYFNTRYYTMNQLLSVEDQCSWISLVNYTHELLSH